MSLITRLFGSQQAQAGLREELMSGISYPSASGVSVTPESALRQAAVYACVQVIAQDVSKLPLVLYRRTYKNGREGRERATDHPLYSLLKLSPNRFQTSLNFREMLTAHTTLRGNGCAFVNRVRGGRVAELLPIQPGNVDIKQDEGSWDVSYVVRDSKGGTRTYDRSQVLHVCGMSLNGYSGVSPVTYARETIGLSIATERYGAQLFKNGAKMGGILTYPGRFKTADTGRAVAQSFDDATSGDNAHKTALLEEGMKWEKVSMTADDAQFLETRKFQIPEVARFFRMPLHKIQELDRATFSNIEHQAIEYVVDTLGSWLVRWEQALNVTLLLPQEWEEYYFEFMVDGLLRGDIKSRYEAYSRGILAGFLNRNEVRARENLDWQDGLDQFLTPTNMAVENGDSKNV